jgi:hypothetical protein
MCGLVPYPSSGGNRKVSYIFLEIFIDRGTLIGIAFRRERSVLSLSRPIGKGIPCVVDAAGGGVAEFYTWRP